MEFNSIETKEIQSITDEAANNETRELDELQLTFVGGGNVIITLG